jgi:ABC-type sugar transport system ATPase subunit
MSAQHPPILQVIGLRKAFGSVTALQDVSLSALEAEITAIVGDNGAGKSTLIKCIAGVHRPDAGTIIFDGQKLSVRSPQEARDRGIETVYQDLALVDDLTVWQNIFLNREIVLGPRMLGIVDGRRMIARSERMLAELAITIPSSRVRVRRLSGGQRQAVAIARATGWGTRMIVLDEPTAALGVRETLHVEDLIRGLRDRGITVLMISHNFDQVLRLSDRIYVLRQGRVVGSRRTAETNGAELVAMVTGLVGDTRAEEIRSTSDAGLGVRPAEASPRRVSDQA